MSKNQIHRCQYQLSLLAVLWIVTLAALVCGFLVAEWNRQELLGVGLLLLGGTVWLCGGMYQIEQEIKRTGKHPPFFQRLWSVLRGLRRPAKSSDEADSLPRV